MGLFKAIKGLLYKDSKCTDNQNDSNDLLAVNRLIIIITALYHFIIFGVLVCSNGLIPATVAGVSGILYALVLMLTYYFNHEKSMFTLVAVSCISNTVLSVQWGGELHFQHFILLLIPILFASIALSVKTKFISSIGLVTLVIVIEHYILHSDPIFVLDELPEHFIIVFSSFAYAVYLTIISYYFCMKFTQAEHKVYVYNRQLKKMASLDPLTGLMNRRGMADMLKDLIDDYNSGTSGLSVAIADIDFFKHVNDKYGHDCGDYILKSIADIFSKFMEGHGEVCRWGGEEFLFAFTNFNTDDVYVFLNDLRHTIKHTRFNFNDTEIRITMTFGLEEYNSKKDIEASIKQADEKLYLGKESGRDKVVY